MRIAIAVSCFALAAHSSFGYIRLGYTEAGGAVIPLSRIDTGAIQYSVNDQIKAGQISSASGASVTVVSPFSNPVAAIRAALGTWNSVPSSKLKFLPLKTTSAVHDSSDFRMTISFASKDDLSILGYTSPASPGAIAITANSWSVNKGALSNGTQVEKGSIIDSDILLNSALKFSTDGSTPYDIQAVITHELGHALGANHSPLLGATMFPYSAVGSNAVLSQRLLSSDDLAFAGAVYGSNAGSMGSISGKVVAADTSAVKAALVTLIDRGGNTLSAISGVDGTWSLFVPPGSYMMYAEPFNDIVGVSDIISLDPAQVTSGFQASVLGGPAAPTEIPVAAGASVTAPNITVLPDTNTFQNPFAGTGSGGGKGDITSVNSATGPSILVSGGSLDIAFVSGGVDATTQIAVFGQGISVRAGSTRVDTGVSFPQGPLIRTTLDVASRQTPTLATVMLYKGTSLFVLSGVAVVVPPKPTFVSNAVISAASFKGGTNGDGVVSPGGLYSIFDIPGAPNLGPSAFALLNGYDVYGTVPTNLAGVSVTFDGIPAPVFFSFNTQLNVQVPFELAGRTSTLVQVTYNGSASNPIRVPVVASQPAFFTAGGPADAIVVNQDLNPDGSYLNSAKYPEGRGRFVTIYGSGIGRSNYPSDFVLPTGQGAPAPPAGYNGGNTCALNGTKTFNVAYTGWTATAVGLAQWTMQLPSDAPTGTVTIICTDANGAVTPPGTLYIK